MRRLIVLSVSALLAAPLFAPAADARPGGFRGGGFHGGVRGPGFRPGFAGAGIVRPGWHGGGTQWAGGWRPGWGPGWRRPGWNWAAAGLGFAAASIAAPYYGYGYDPYGYYAADYDCPTVQRRVWNGYRYRIVWVNSCGYY